MGDIMTPENQALIEQVKKFYNTYNETKGSNAADVIDLCADDIRWQSLGAPAAGTEFLEDGTGKEKVRTYLRDLYAGWTMLHYTVNEFIVSDDRIVILSDVEFEFDATQKRVATPKADIMHIKDGQITNFFEFYDTAALQAATLS